MIKVGIIGLGKMGQIRADAVKADGNGEVVAVFEPEKNGHFDKFPIYSSSDDIINDPKVDAVFICTPNSYNKPLTVQSLQAGKHVFCEKPPAFNSEEMQEVIDAEKSSGKKLMFGFNHRHHSSIKYMKQLIDSNEYGKVLWMRGRYGKSVDKQFFSSWRAKKETAGGGILLDQGIHMLDLFLHLGGHFDEVQAFVSNLYWKLDIEDNVFANLRNSQSGMVASLHSTMTQWRHLFSLEIFLKRGYMALNGLITSSGTYGDEVLAVAKNRSTAPAATWQDEERIKFKSDVSWRSEINHFFNAINGYNDISIGTSADALALMNTVDMIYNY